MSLYFSEIGKLQVGICYFYTFFLIIETFSIRQNYCKLLVAGAGTLDPGVSATDDSIMAARHNGTRDGDGPWPRMQSQLLKQYLSMLLQVSVLGVGSEHVFCHL